MDNGQKILIAVSVVLMFLGAFLFKKDIDKTLDGQSKKLPIIGPCLYAFGFALFVTATLR